MDTRMAAPATVGEILLEEFLIPNMYTLEELALSLEMTEDQLAELLSDKHLLTNYEAERLGTYFETGGEFWINIRDSHLRWKSRMKK